ncbi:hypothetical protein LTR86_002053 [Recurvomyces mirabilis]|nr:hypothetical protein LTR86_002053 [Recurvomyces mirabilis]
MISRGPGTFALRAAPVDGPPKPTQLPMQGTYATSAARKEAVSVTGQLPIPQHKSSTLVVQNESPTLHATANTKLVPTDTSAVTHVKPGKASYKWSASIHRKLLRARRFLPIPPGLIAKDLENAGGPSTQTTNKAIVAITGVEKPCDDLLKGAQSLGTKAKLFQEDDTDPGVKSACQLRGNLENDKSQACTHTPLGAIVGVDDHPISALSNQDILDSLRSHQVPEVETMLACSTEETDILQSRKRSKRPLSIETRIENESGGRKQQRNRSTRTSASQISVDYWISLLADHGVPEKKVRRIICGLSIHASSNSTQSIEVSNAKCYWKDATSLIPPADGPGACALLLSSPLQLEDHDVQTAEEINKQLDQHAGRLSADFHKLLKCGASATEIAVDGQSALYIAVRLGYRAICAMLLWLGADQPFVGLDHNISLLETLLRGTDRTNKDKDSVLAVVQYSRMITCLDYTICSLKEADRDKRMSSKLLLDHCRALDPHKERCLEREREHEDRKRRTQLWRTSPMKTALGSCTLPAVSPDSGYVGTPGDQVVPTLYDPPLEPLPHPQSCDGVQYSPGIPYATAELYSPQALDAQTSHPEAYVCLPSSNQPILSSSSQTTPKLSWNEDIMPSYAHRPHHTGTILADDLALPVLYDAIPQNPVSAMAEAQTRTLSRDRRHGRQDWSQDYYSSPFTCMESFATDQKPGAAGPQLAVRTNDDINQRTPVVSNFLEPDHGLGLVGINPYMVPSPYSTGMLGMNDGSDTPTGIIARQHMSWQGSRSSTNVQSQIQFWEDRQRKATLDSSRLEIEATWARAKAAEAQRTLLHLRGQASQIRTTQPNSTFPWSNVTSTPAELITWPELPFLPS